MYEHFLKTLKRKENQEHSKKQFYWAKFTYDPVPSFKGCSSGFLYSGIWPTLSVINLHPPHPKKACTPYHNFPFSRLAFLSPWLLLTLSLWVCLFWTFRRNGIIWSMVLCVWLLYLAGFGLAMYRFILFCGWIIFSCIQHCNSICWLGFSMVRAEKL